jgi:hypothetical protein
MSVDDFADFINKQIELELNSNESTSANAEVNV